jgi:hypothetical protein
LAELPSETEFSDEVPQLEFVVMRPMQEADYFIEIPSLILHVLHYSYKYSKMEISRLLDERSSLIFSEFLLPDEVFQFLVKTLSLLFTPDLYFTATLNSSSPLFQIRSTLTISLIPNVANLKNYQAAINRITLNAVIQNAIPVSSAFYDGMIRNFAAKEVPHLFEIQHMRQNAELFMLSSSAANSQAVSKTLIDESEFFDSLSTVLFARLLKIEHGFMFVLLVAKKYFVAAAIVER